MKRSTRTISVSLNGPGISSVTATTSPGSIVTPVVVPGTLDISSVPGNASVVINGSYQGHTPMNLSGLSPGAYQINFSKFNYEPISTMATVEAGAITEVNAALQPKTGTLLINTNPEGARIVLDGINVGLSPLTEAGLAAGNHTINATLNGYIPIEVQVGVIADESVNCTIELKSASLVPGNLTPLPVAVTIGACMGGILLFVFVRRHDGV